MATILSQQKHINTSCYHHSRNTSFISRKIHKLIHHTSCYHHSRHTSFISRKIHYLRKSKSFKKFIIQIHPSLKTSFHFWNLSWIFEIWNHSFEIHDFLQVLISHLNFFWKSLLNYEFFLSDILLEVLNSSLELWDFLNLLNFSQWFGHINTTDHIKFGLNISR